VNSERAANGFSAEEISNESLSGSLIRLLDYEYARAYFTLLDRRTCRVYWRVYAIYVISRARIAGKASLVPNNRECHSRRRDCQPHFLSRERATIKEAGQPYAAKETNRSLMIQHDGTRRKLKSLMPATERRPVHGIASFPWKRDSFHLAEKLASGQSPARGYRRSFSSKRYRRERGRVWSSASESSFALAFKGTARR